MLRHVYKTFLLYFIFMMDFSHYVVRVKCNYIRLLLFSGYMVKFFSQGTHKKSADSVCRCILLTVLIPTDGRHMSESDLLHIWSWNTQKNSSQNNSFICYGSSVMCVIKRILNKSLDMCLVPFFVLFVSYFCLLLIKHHIIIILST